MKRLSIAIITLLACAGAQAASEQVEMNLVTSQGVGQSIGSVTISETAQGLAFTPDLKALPPGEHGSMSMPTAAVSLRLKKAKLMPLNRQGDILTRIKPENMKVRRGLGTWATYRCWWSMPKVTPQRLLPPHA